MKKRKTASVISLALAAALAVSLSGCGRTQEPVKDPDTGTASVSAPAETPVTGGKIWAALDDDTTNYTGWAAEFDAADMKCVRLDVMGETESIYNTTDTDLIDEIFRAMDQITVTGPTDERVAGADQMFTFIENDGEEISIEFNDNNLVGADDIYLLSGDADLWDAAINLRENASESYTEEKENTAGSVTGDEDDPMNGRVEQAAGSAAHFSYEKESTGDGTEIIFGDALVVTIPPDWNGKYTMEKSNDHVTFYHTASHEAWQQEDGSDGGVLFGIYYSDSGNSEDDQDAGLARDGGHYYFSFPSDFQGYAEDDDIAAEYVSLFEEVDSIAGNAFSTVSE